MNPRQVFKDKAFITVKKTLTEAEDEFLFKIIRDIFSEFKNEKEISEIETIEENENFDSYKVTQKETGLSFNVKISLDKESFLLKNEGRFLFKNKSVFTNSYIHHGSKRIGGSNIIYLVSSHENAEDISEAGSGYLFENFSSLLSAAECFSELECRYDFDFYIEKLLSDKIIDADSELLNDFKNKGEILGCLKEIKTHILKNYDKKMFNIGQACHVNLKKQNVITRNGLFKFINCSDVFSGTILFSICNLCLNAGFNEKQMTSIIKNYSEFTKSEEVGILKAFNRVMKLAVPIFYLNILYEAFIEQKFFQNRRAYKFIDLAGLATSNYYYLSKLPKTKKIIQDLIIKPISNSQCDVTLPPPVTNKEESEEQSLNVQNRSTELDKPKLNVRKIEDKNKNVKINLSWDRVVSATGYSPYIKKPNGLIAEKPNTRDLSIEFENIDLIGHYGVGVRSLSSTGKDSEYAVNVININDLPVKTTKQNKK